MSLFFTLGLLDISSRSAILRRLETAAFIRARKEEPSTATTYIKPYKTSPGMTALETMQDRYEYGLNPEKCAVTSSHLCDPATAHLEFMLTKCESLRILFWACIGTNVCGMVIAMIGWLGINHALPVDNGNCWDTIDR